MAVVRIIPSRKTTTTQSTGARRNLHQELILSLDVPGVFRVPCTCRVVKVAAAEDVLIQYLSRSKEVRKKNLVAEFIARRGTHPGLGHALSVTEGCTAFNPWIDKRTKKIGA